MTGIDEAAAGKNQMASALAAGTDQVSQFQQITFTKYRRLILPADGFVFWVKNSLLNPSAQLDTSTLNSFTPNAPQAPIDPSRYTDAQRQEAILSSFTVPGSLHYATSLDQGEEETFATNTVIFTSQAEVTRLNDVGPETLFLATYQGIRFSFSNREAFYTQAGLWHYTGRAVFADMESQIIEEPRQLDASQLIVSNSLPIWLAMNGAGDHVWDLIPRPLVPLYPSYLVDMNLPPPFISVHVEPGGTEAIAAAPTFADRLSQAQFTRDHVKLTLFGLNNGMAQDTLAWMIQYSLDNPGLLGISNSPIVRDEKRPQVELQAIAQKKTIDFDVNYYQSRARDTARQLLLIARATYIAEDFATILVA
jgi:hypothetical protein